MASRIPRLLGRGRSEQTPAYAIGAVTLVLCAVVGIILAIAFTLWAVL